MTNFDHNTDFQSVLIQYQAFNTYAPGGPNYSRVKKAFIDCATDLAHRNNDPEAVFWLCYDALTRADFTVLTPANIITMLEGVEDHQYAPALTLLGQIYVGWHTLMPIELQNKKRGWDLLRQGVEMQYAPAFSSLAWIYDQQMDTQSYRRITSYLAQKFAKLGYAGAYLYLAEQALLKKPRTISAKRNVLNLLRKGQDLIAKLPYEVEYIGDCIRFRLGVCLYEGLDGITKREEGLSLIKQASSNYADAQSWLKSRDLQVSEEEKDAFSDDTDSFCSRPGQTGDLCTKLKQPLFPDDCSASSANKIMVRSLDLTPEKIEALLEPLNRLIGLSSVKKEIHSLINTVRVNDQRRRAGLKTPAAALHMVFSGNPGTGKTSVARIMGEIFKGMGLLTKGHVVEVSRQDLVGEYIGWTEAATKKAICKAEGGILFVDEAYTLSDRGSDWDFGPLAIDTIAKAMEDQRDNFIVIGAGYKKEMKQFLSSSPGLASRFAYQIEFADYNAGEMEEIFTLLCNENDYSMSADAKIKLLTGLKGTKDKANKSDFGNARFVRQLFEATLRRQSERIAKLSDPSKDDLMHIEAHDLAFTEPVGDGRIVYMH